MGIQRRARSPRNGQGVWSGRADGAGGAARGLLALLICLGVLSHPGLAAATRGPADAGQVPESGQRPDTGQIVGQLGFYITRYEDTLLEVGRRFSLGFVELVAANPGVDPWVPGEGRRLILPTAHIVPDAPHAGIVINITEMRMYYFDSQDRPPKTFAIGVGREGWGTPIGATRIVRKMADPTWYPPASIRAENPALPGAVPPGPANPLGAFALYLGVPGYLIHGTNKPYGVGRRVSHGCLRMYPEDIAYLFEAVPVGTPVTIVEQQAKFAWYDGELYVEIHPTPDQADVLESEQSADPVIMQGLLKRAYEVAGEARGRLDLERLLQANVEARGYPIRITK